MSLKRIALAAALLCSMAFSAAGQALARVVDYALSFWPAEARPFALPTGFGLSLASGPDTGSIGSALYQDNRHESGVPRRSADRHV